MSNDLGMRWLKYQADGDVASAKTDAFGWQKAQETLGKVDDERDSFLRREALYRLVDWADLYLANSRTDRWMSRHLHFKGDSIPSRAALALTIHHGAGMWGMRALGRAGQRSAWVHAPVSDVVAPGQRLWAKLAKWRIATVARANGAPCIATPGAYDKMLAWAKQGHGVNGLIDAPAHFERQCSVVPVLGRSFRLTNGFARFAVAQKIPVYLYTTTLSGDASHRVFRGRYLGRMQDVEEMMILVGQWMTEEIMRDPAAWHLWRFIDQFVVSDASQN